LLGRVRYPGADLVRAATRPETVPGHLREAASLAITAAVWPFGWIDRGLHELRRRAEEDAGDIPTPVLLVHGYGANKSNWFFLERALRDAGFGVIHALNYNPLRAEVPRLAGACTRRARDLMDHTGTDRVHLVGHSLGGVVARYAVQLGGLTEAATCVTIASPHRGAPLARLAPRGTAAQLAPGSALLRALSTAARPSPTRFVAYYSNLDLLVPGRRAMITEPALDATNTLVKDEGHTSIMLSRRLAEAVAAELVASEAAAAAPAPGGPQAGGTALGIAG
jgi:pimeloyl-ACP methyl ester carboxylesterase